MSERYIVVGKHTDSIEVLDVSVSTASLEEPDVEMYLEWSGMSNEEFETLSKYSFFTTDAKMVARFESTAREALVYSIDSIGTYRGVKVVSSEAFSEYWSDVHNKVVDYENWITHKKKMVDENAIEF
jgi:hypothetical protein